MTNRSFNDQVEKVAKEFLNWINSLDRVFLVTHYDADGLTAGAIMGSTLNMLGVKYHLRVIEQLDTESLQWIKEKTEYPIIIFTDLGSGYKKLIHKYLLKRNVLIIDHHELETTENSPNVLEVNPRIHGIDGSSELCSAGAAYVLSKNLIGDAALKLAPLAVVGALGDRQDRGPLFSLVGLNQAIAKEAESNGFLRIERGLRLAGLRNRPLVKCLAYTFDPYLPGLSGDENACFSFLKNIGVSPIIDDELRTYDSLTSGEAKKLATELIKHLISSGLPVKEAERIFGTLYLLVQEESASPLYDAREFAVLLNACGRTNRQALGVLIALGYRNKVLKEAVEVMETYRKAISSTLSKIREEKEKYFAEEEHFILIDLRGIVSSRILGAIASIISSSREFSATKPIIALAEVDDKIKVSARMPAQPLAQYKKMNLGHLIQEVAGKVDGVGGGHEAAGGALIDKKSLNTFIRYLNDNINKYILG